MWNKVWASPVSHPLQRAIRNWPSPNTTADQSSDHLSTVKSERSLYHHSSPNSSISSLRIRWTWPMAYVGLGTTNLSQLLSDAGSCRMSRVPFSLGERQCPDRSNEILTRDYRQGYSITPRYTHPKKKPSCVCLGPDVRLQDWIPRNWEPSFK